MKLRDIQDLRAFSFVYQERSFTKAAKRLGISKASVAKRVAQLEQEFQVSLFRRTTRNVSATPEGDALFLKAQNILESVRELESSFLENEEMEGTIRVTCVAAMSVRFLSDLMMQFQKDYPRVKIEMVVTDSFLDLVEANIDISVRIGNLPNSSLVGRKLGFNDLVVCASPAYLKTNKRTRKTASDLKNDTLLFLDMHQDRKFAKSQMLVKELAPLRKFTCNDALSLTAAGLEGHGILIRSRWDVQKFIETGELIEILKDDYLDGNGHVWLLASAGRLQSKRVRALYEYILEKTKALFPAPPSF